MLPVEIERKYLIAMPDPSWLNALRREEITQTYLLAGPGEERRVRRKSTQGREVFVKTTKRVISFAKREEIEEEISREEYAALLLGADPACRTIRKTRYSMSFGGHMLEIDVYPFWTGKAILEVELNDEREEISLPDALHIIREVTDDPRYKNASFAKAENPAQLV